MSAIQQGRKSPYLDPNGGVAARRRGAFADGGQQRFKGVMKQLRPGAKAHPSNHIEGKTLSIGDDRRGDR